MKFILDYLARPAGVLSELAAPSLSADQVLGPHVGVFCAAFVAAFVATPVMRWVALRCGMVDKPDEARKLHAAPVAYLGGVAVLVGWLVGLAVSRLSVGGDAGGAGGVGGLAGGGPAGSPWAYAGVALAGASVAAVGFWDDLRKVRPLVKLCGQVVAALCLLAFGVGTGCARPLFTPMVRYAAGVLGRASPLAGGQSPMWFDTLVLGGSAILVVLVIVGCCNATNLMDGLDGLCGGVTAIIVAGFLFLAVHLATSGGGFNAAWNTPRVILGLALLGAVLGFVPYNFNPASIFMGDTGSMFLGFCCGTMIILLAQAQSKWFLAAMVMFALPVLDTSLAFARRWIAGRPLFSADAQHFHHQLMQRGYTVRQTVMICYGLAVGFALLGAAIAFMRTRYAGAFYLVIFGSIVVAAYKMGMVHERVRPARAAAKPRERAVVGGFARGGAMLGGAAVVGLVKPAGAFETQGDADDEPFGEGAVLAG